jgi:hypothetical protein
MKVFVFLLFSIMSYGQHIHLSMFSKRMDSIYTLKHDRFIVPIVDDSVEKFRMTKWVKVTVKTSINGDVFEQLDSEEVSIGDLEAEDYLSIGKYDVRVRVYLSRDIRFVCQMVAAGIQVSDYTYRCGLIIKF